MPAMKTSVPPVTVTTCECDFRTGKSFGWTIFFGLDISFLKRRFVFRQGSRSNALQCRSRTIEKLSMTRRVEEILCDDSEHWLRRRVLGEKRLLRQTLVRRGEQSFSDPLQMLSMR